MLDFTSKNQQFRQKNRMQVLLLFIAMMPMAFLQAQCPAVNVPYVQDFQSSEGFPACTSTDDSGTGANWTIANIAYNGFTSRNLRYSYDNQTGNAWFFTRGINLVANTAYKISYEYGGSDSDLIESLKVAYGTSASAAGMTLPLADHPEITTGLTLNTVNFTPAASGVYYFGFKAYSRPNQQFLQLDNITVAAAVANTSPVITNFTSLASCGQFTALAINGTNLANATVTIGGTPITLVNNTATLISALILTAMSGPIVVTTPTGTATSATNFTFNLATPITLSDNDTTICAGTSSGTVTITSGASAYTEYTWDPSEGVTGNSTSGWVFSPTDDFNAYLLTASNPTTGCTGTKGYIVQVTPSPATPVITAPSLTMCEGSNLELTSSATTGNVWSTNAATNSITVTNSGSYTVTVTQDGCSATSAPAVVTVNPKPAIPVITTPPSLAMCEGNNLVLTSSATSGNVWSTNATTNSITVTNAGSYTVTVTQNGCSATSAPVTVNPKPLAGASLTGNVTITASPAGQTYQWVNCTTNVPVSGATGATFTATANGSYKVIVTNAGGCKDTSACVNVSKVGLDENSMDIGVSLYPNPTEGNVYVTMTETEAADVVVFDAQGKVVFTMNDIVNGTVIDMNHTEKGIYLVKVSNAKGTNVFRMVKK